MCYTLDSPWILFVRDCMWRCRENPRVKSHFYLGTCLLELLWNCFSVYLLAAPRQCPRDNNERTCEFQRDPEPIQHSIFHVLLGYLWWNPHVISVDAPFLFFSAWLQDRRSQRISEPKSEEDSWSRDRESKER